MPAHLQVLVIQLLIHRNLWGKMRGVMLVLDSPIPLIWDLPPDVSSLSKSKNVLVAGTYAVNGDCS